MHAMRGFAQGLCGLRLSASPFYLETCYWRLEMTANEIASGLT